MKNGAFSSFISYWAGDLQTLRWKPRCYPNRLWTSVYNTVLECIHICILYVSCICILYMYPICILYVSYMYPILAVSRCRCAHVGTQLSHVVPGTQRSPLPVTFPTVQPWAGRCFSNNTGWTNGSLGYRKVFRETMPKSDIFSDEHLGKWWKFIHDCQNMPKSYTGLKRLWHFVILATKPHTFSFLASSSSSLCVGESSSLLPINRSFSCCQLPVLLVQFCIPFALHLPHLSIVSVSWSLHHK